MIGIIVTGHGNFATGMTSALALITGGSEGCVPVDFTSADGVAELQADLAAALDGFAGVDGVLVLADLVGGSPFKAAVELSATRDDVRVVAGTNLGCLVEAYMSRDTVASAAELATMAAGTARSTVVEFKLMDDEPEDDDIFGDDGI